MYGQLTQHDFEV